MEDCAAWTELVEVASQAWADVRHVGAVARLCRARATCLESPPDVLLLDLWLPDGDGLELAAELRRKHAPIRIIACTAREDAVALHSYDALRLDGLLLKCGSLPVALRTALDRVRAGGRYLAPELSERHGALRADPAAYYKLLSPRQQALLPLLGCGLPDDAITQRTAVSASAVRAHRYRIMRTLGLSRAPELMRWAVRTGFVPPSLFTDREAGDWR